MASPSTGPVAPKQKMEIKEGHTTGSGAIDPFGIVAVDPNGRRKSFSHGGDMFYQSDDDEELYLKSTGGTPYENYIRLGAVEAPQADSGGGGGGAPASDWRDSVRQTSNPVDDQGKTTADILGDSYASMNAYTPVTPGQVANPLVQAGNWMTEVNPANQVAYNDPGIFVNPQIGMLQDSWVNQSANPYSLLG